MIGTHDHLHSALSGICKSLVQVLRNDVIVNNNITVCISQILLAVKLHPFLSRDRHEFFHVFGAGCFHDEIGVLLRFFSVTGNHLSALGNDSSEQAPCLRRNSQRCHRPAAG